VDLEQLGGRRAVPRRPATLTQASWMGASLEFDDGDRASTGARANSTFKTARRSRHVTESVALRFSGWDASTTLRDGGTGNRAEWVVQLRLTPM